MGGGTGMFRRGVRGTEERGRGKRGRWEGEQCTSGKGGGGEERERERGLEEVIIPPRLLPLSPGVHSGYW